MEKSEPRKITTKDGTVMYTWNGKFHHWDKPAELKQMVLKNTIYMVFNLLKRNGNYVGKNERDYPFIRQEMLMLDFN